MLKGAYKARLNCAVHEQHRVAIPAISFNRLGFLDPMGGQSSEAATNNILSASHIKSSMMVNLKNGGSRKFYVGQSHGYGACQILLLEDKIWKTFIIAMCSGTRSPYLHLGLSTVWFYEVLLWNDFCTAYKSFYSKI